MTCKYDKHMINYDGKCLFCDYESEFSYINR